MWRGVQTITSPYSSIIPYESIDDDLDVCQAFILASTHAYAPNYWPVILQWYHDVGAAFEPAKHSCTPHLPLSAITVWALV